MSKENIKAASLVLLFLTSLILMTIKLDLIDYSKMMKKKPYNSSLSLEQGLQYTLRPSRTFIHLGGGNHTEAVIDSNDYWQEAINILKSTLKNDPKIANSTISHYDDLKNYKSLDFDFPPGISGKLLSRSFFLDKSPLTSFEKIDGIIIPLVNEGGVYIKGEEKGQLKIIKVIGERSKIELVDKLEKSQYVGYYPLNTLFEGDNNVLIPLDVSYNIPSFKTQSTLDSRNEEFCQELFQRIFEEKYDFSNRIEEISGAIVMSYNYGEEILRIEPHGYVEYIDENISMKDTVLEEGLLQAFEFLQNRTNSLEKFSIKEIISREIRGKTGYEVVFQYGVNGINVSPQDPRDEIRVLLVGDKIYQATGTFRVPILQLDSAHSTYQNSIKSPLEIVNENYEYIIKEMKDIEIKDGQELLRNINSIQLTYYMNSKKNIIPIWKVSFYGKEFLFDGNTGKVVKYGLGQS